MGWRGLFLVLGLMLTQPAAAQEPVAATGPSAAVLVVDLERMIGASAYADSLRAAVEAQAEVLAIENERIVADLTAEERSLTLRRPTMDPQAFREEAAAFDAKVNDIRRARDAKEAEVNQARAEVRQRFIEEARPILGQLMIEKGATAVVDSRSVVVVVRSADITNEAIRRIDAVLMPDAPVADDE